MIYQSLDTTKNAKMQKREKRKRIVDTTRQELYSF